MVRKAFRSKKSSTFAFAMSSFDHKTNIKKAKDELATLRCIQGVLGNNIRQGYVTATTFSKLESVTNLIPVVTKYLDHLRTSIAPPGGLVIDEASSSNQ
jgi:hypothetical protein